MHYKELLFLIHLFSVGFFFLVFFTHFLLVVCRCFLHTFPLLIMVLVVVVTCEDIVGLTVLLFDCFRAGVGLAPFHSAMGMYICMCRYVIPNTSLFSRPILLAY